MELSQLAVPSVFGLISFLGLPSQWMLMRLDPRPLERNEILTTNAFLILIYITYSQTVWVDPGRIPKDWAGEELGSPDSKTSGQDSRQEKETSTPSTTKDENILKTRKWCRKCSAPKPPRAHHCKICARCIPKMDHHCPWTANCVSHTTLPHFMRFLAYTTAGLTWLEYLLWPRLAHLWSNRDLPAYLGPSPALLGLLFVILLVNSLTLFAIGILFLRNIWCLALNTTTIEGWEIARHATLVRRARTFGGYLDAPDGSRLRIKKQEFPYDIGIWANVAQGMGSSNPLVWFWPFARTPSVASGLSFPTNGFEERGAVWPPPDPDRVYRRAHAARDVGAESEGTFKDEGLAPREHLAAFRARQAEDEVRRRRPFIERAEEELQRQRMQDWNRSASNYNGQHSYSYENEHDDGMDYAYGDDADGDLEDEGKERRTYPDEGEESWRNSEGEGLQDFGVDADVEFYDEADDEIPLGELLARRREGVVMH